MTLLATSFSCRILEKEQGSTWKQTVQDYCALLAFSGLLWSARPRGQHPPSQINKWNRQPASVLTGWLTRKLQNSHPAQAWLWVMPKQAAYKNKRFFKKWIYTTYRRLQSPWMAILEQPGPAQLQGQRGSCIPVTLGGVGQLKVELVPLAPCSRQREGGREQERHCTPSPSSRSSFLPRSGLCLHLTGIKSKFGQRHLPPEPHDLPVHQLHCKAQRGQRRGKNHQKISKEGTAGHQLLLCCAPSIPKGEGSRTGPSGHPLPAPPQSKAPGKLISKEEMLHSSPDAFFCLLSASQRHPQLAPLLSLQTAPPNSLHRKHPTGASSYHPASPGLAGYSGCR